MHLDILKFLFQFVKTNININSNTFDYIIDLHIFQLLLSLLPLTTVMGPHKVGR